MPFLITKAEFDYMLKGEPITAEKLDDCVGAYWLGVLILSAKLRQLRKELKKNHSLPIADQAIKDALEQMLPRMVHPDVAFHAVSEKTWLGKNDKYLRDLLRKMEYEPVCKLLTLYSVANDIPARQIVERVDPLSLLTPKYFASRGALTNASDEFGSQRKDVKDQNLVPNYMLLSKREESAE